MEVKSTEKTIGTTFYAVNLDLPAHSEPMPVFACEKGVQFPTPPPDVSRAAYITHVSLAAACAGCKMTLARLTGMETGRLLNLFPLFHYT
jgi:hypothetical protein